MPEARPSPDRFNHPPLQPDWIDRPHHLLDLGDFKLESGEVIHDFCLSYVMHGELDERRSNAILCVTPIGSVHHKYDFLIGPGLALDPDRFCIIIADAIGNGLSTSPSTSLRQRGTDFPRFAIRDMVESQRVLADRLGIVTFYAAFGASMGGMQVLQWAVSHPRRLARAVALVPLAKTPSWSASVNEASRLALMADPEWAAGYDNRGWPAWVAIMQILAGRTPAAMAAECSNAGAAIEAIAERVRRRTESGLRPIDWIYQTYAYDGHDVGATPGFGGDVALALASIRAQTLVVTAPSDLYNPTAAGSDAARLIPRCAYLEMSSIYGHQAANGVDPEDAAFLNRHVSAFLA